MTISNLTDSDGNDFQVWVQEQTNSCTIASIWMARAIARQMSFEEDEWSLAHRLYHSVIAGSDAAEDIGPQTFNPSSHTSDQATMGGTFSRFGVIPGQIASMMRQEGFGVTMAAESSVNFSKLGPTKPALVGIRWRSNASGSWVDRGGTPDCRGPQKFKWAGGVSRPGLWWPPDGIEQQWANPPSKQISHRICL